MAKAKKYDIAIAGGGMVGLTLAVALAQNGVRVFVADAAPTDEVLDAKFDGRVSAIAFASCRMLKTLGLWPALAPAAQPINDILVSDGSVRKGASALFLSFDHREIGDEPLGHLIENRHLRKVLIEAVHNTPDLTFKAPARVTGFEAQTSHIDIQLTDEKKVSAQVLLAADGRGSPLRGMAGIKEISWPYNQSGIVTTVEHERPHHGIAQEFFLPAGPFAILPMTGNRASLVWTEKHETADALMGLDDKRFAAEIAHRFGTMLGATQPVGPRWSYPLGLHLARSYTADRLALVGDAAHGIHPIAGQGLNLGLRDVAALAEVLVGARRTGLDLGAPAILKQYEKWRRFDNLTLALGTDLLNRLFSNDIGPVRLVRGLGLALVGQTGFARRAFMRHAGGIFGLSPESLPRLLRGEAL